MWDLLAKVLADSISWLLQKKRPLLILGLASLGISLKLLSPGPNTPPERVIARAKAGIVLSILGGLLIIIWIWRR